MIKIEGISIDYETSEEEYIEEVEVLVEEKPEPVKKMRKKVNNMVYKEWIDKKKE